MNIVFSGVLAAGFAASAVLFSRHGLPEPQPTPSEPVRVAAVSGTAAFRLTGPGGRDACNLTRTEAAAGPSAVVVSANCDRLLPGLSAVRTWRERADGSIALDDASGRTLAQFALADGAGYESYKPVLPLLSLVREN